MVVHRQQKKLVFENATECNGDHERSHKRLRATSLNVVGISILIDLVVDWDHEYPSFVLFVTGKRLDLQHT
jgi:hypothetical protein